jgi:hypothetical protein
MNLILITVGVLTLGDILLTTLCSNSQEQKGADSQAIEGEAMDRYKWHTEIGGVLLVLGLVTAFLALFAPDPDSPKWKEKEHLPWWSNFWFYTGLVFGIVGFLLQILGSILPPSVGNDR